MPYTTPSGCKLEHNQSRDRVMGGARQRLGRDRAGGRRSVDKQRLLLRAVSQSARFIYMGAMPRVALRCG